MGLVALGNKKEIKGLRIVLYVLLTITVIMTSGIVTYLLLFSKRGLEDAYLPLFALVIPFIISITIAWISLKKLFYYINLPSVSIAYDEEEKSLQVMTPKDLYEIELNEIVCVSSNKNRIIIKTKDDEEYKSITLENPNDVLISINSLLEA